MSVLIFLAGIAGYLAQKTKTDGPSSIRRTLDDPVNPPKKIIRKAPAKKVSSPTTSSTLKTESDFTPDIPESAEEPLNEREAHVDRIKKQIYDINVEYIEDVPLLNDIVQDSAAEPLGLWEGKWVSVDDWKRYDDLFTIETDKTGAFKLVPDQDGAQSYHYDEEKKEFSWELDYYGKIITHKAKFISDDVMVLMKISGIKVALDIYTRIPNEQPESTQ